MTAERLVSVAVVARLLGVSCWTIRRYVESGEIPPEHWVRLPSGHYRFRVELIGPKNKSVQTVQTEQPSG